MKVSEVYRDYIALKMHFETDTYDYHRYRGMVKVSEKAFNKRNDKNNFIKISKLPDPHSFLVGNFLYNQSFWIGHFNEDCHKEFVSVERNGLQTFSKDIKMMSDDFRDNFIVSEDRPIPKILSLAANGKISFRTVCAFETLLGMNAEWEDKPQYLVFGKQARYVSKCHLFFNTAKDIDKYKDAALRHF